MRICFFVSVSYIKWYRLVFRDANDVIDSYVKINLNVRASDNTTTTFYEYFSGASSVGSIYVSNKYVPFSIIIILYVVENKRKIYIKSPQLMSLYSFLAFSLHSFFVQ